MAAATRSKTALNMASCACCLFEKYLLDGLLVWQAID
jgi:hypothetical protein